MLAALTPVVRFRLRKKRSFPPSLNVIVSLSLLIFRSWRASHTLARPVDEGRMRPTDPLGRTMKSVAVEQHSALDSLLSVC